MRRKWRFGEWVTEYSKEEIYTLYRKEGMDRENALLKSEEIYRALNNMNQGDRRAHQNYYALHQGGGTFEMPDQETI